MHIYLQGDSRLLIIIIGFIGFLLIRPCDH